MRLDKADPAAADGDSDDQAEERAEGDQDATLIATAAAFARTSRERSIG